MPRLAFSVDKYTQTRVAAQPVEAPAVVTPRVRANANLRIPFYQKPEFAAALSALALIAVFAMAGAMWKLFHFVR